MTLNQEIKARLDRVIANKAYTEADFYFFCDLYSTGKEELREELRALLDVPSDYECQNR